MIVVLDSGVLGRLCAPTIERELDVWLTGLLQRGRRVLIPEVCDYEIRREMVRTASAYRERRPVVVATTNVAHLTRMVDARAWRDIS